MIDEYKIDGVIDVVLQACHTYNAETLIIRNLVEDNKHIPYLIIETDYSQYDVGQLGTMVAEFIGILK